MANSNELVKIGVLLKDVKDVEGHWHSGETGQFVSGSGPGSGHGPREAEPSPREAEPQRSPGQQLQAEERAAGQRRLNEYHKAGEFQSKPGGAVDFEHLLAREMQLGLTGETKSVEHPKFHLFIGPGASGKSAYVEHFMGGKRSAAKPGYDKKNYFSADEQKERIPNYTPATVARGDRDAIARFGKEHPQAGGSSGPFNEAEMHEMWQPEHIKEFEDYIREHTKFKSIKDFVDNYVAKQRREGEPEYGGGLVHELSSHLARHAMDEFLEKHPRENAVHEGFGTPLEGNPENPYATVNMAQRAHDAGYSVHVHHVDPGDLRLNFLQGMMRPRILRSQHLPQGKAKADKAAAETMSYFSDKIKNGEHGWHLHMHNPLTGPKRDAALRLAQRAGITQEGQEEVNAHPRYRGNAGLKNLRNDYLKSNLEDRFIDPENEFELGKRKADDGIPYADIDPERLPEAQPLEEYLDTHPSQHEFVKKNVLNFLADEPEARGEMIRKLGKYADQWGISKSKNSPAKTQGAGELKTPQPAG